MAYIVETNAFKKVKLIEELNEIAGAMSASRLTTLNKFARQVVEIHDVDAIETFLKWKDHQVLDTILLLVAALEEDEQYEILHKAEDLINQCKLKVTCC